MNRIDMSAKLLNQPFEPITFFNHIEEATITNTEIQVLKQIDRLHALAFCNVANPDISLKILKIGIIRNTHHISLKLSKDIIEYLDATLLKR